MFSDRTSWDLSPNALTAALEKRRRQGRPVLDLMVSNPTCAGLNHLQGIDLTPPGTSSRVYRPEALGLPAARQAVSDYYRERGLDVAAHRLLLTASTSEAYAYLFKLLADPGDEILVPRPSYPLFQYLGELEGVRVGTYPLRYGEDGWRVDVDRLGAAVGPRTRALVVVSPNNPTGSYITPAERAALEGVALDCGLALIADEVFADYPLEAPERGGPSLATDSRVLTFALSGLSKVLGLPQLKLSWLAVDGPEAEAADALSRLEVIADTYLSVGTPVQEALPRLLGHRIPIQTAIAARLRANLSLLRERAAGCQAVEVLRCEGGWYAVLRIETDAEELALRLLEGAGVLVHPGAFYDFPPGEFLVVSLLSQRLAEGVERVLALL